MAKSDVESRLKTQVKAGNDLNSIQVYNFVDAQLGTGFEVLGKEISPSTRRS